MDSVWSFAVSENLDLIRFCRVVESCLSQLASFFYVFVTCTYVLRKFGRVRVDHWSTDASVTQRLPEVDDVLRVMMVYHCFPIVCARSVMSSAVSFFHKRFRVASESLKERSVQLLPSRQGLTVLFRKDRCTVLKLFLAQI